MSDGGEARAAWLDQALDFVERHGLTIAPAPEAGSGDYIVQNSAGHALCRGPSINDALCNLPPKT